MNQLQTRIMFQRKLSLFTRSKMTNIQGTEPQYTITDMPHPRSLPVIGTKLHLLAAGSGKR